jgi:hypothetical protein
MRTIEILNKGAYEYLKFISLLAVCTFITSVLLGFVHLCVEAALK